MLRGDPKTQLEIGTRDRRCWNCGHWEDDEFPAAGAQPMGYCRHVRWLVPGEPIKCTKGPSEPRMVEQLTHADDVCAKFEASHGHSPIEAEDWAQQAGLG